MNLVPEYHVKTVKRCAVHLASDSRIDIVTELLLCVLLEKCDRAIEEKHVGIRIDRVDISDVMTCMEAIIDHIMATHVDFDADDLADDLCGCYNEAAKINYLRDEYIIVDAIATEYIVWSRGTQDVTSR